MPRRYTYYALEFLETVKQDSKKTMAEFLAVCPKRLCISTVGTRTDLFARDPKKVGVTSTGLCNSQCLIKQVIVENYQTPKIFLVEVFLIPNIITRR